MPMVNDDYFSDRVSFQFSSPFVYHQEYLYTHRTKTNVMTKEIKLQGNPKIIRNEFECKQFMVPGHDGTEIPLNLYFKKDLMKMNRRNRVVLEGYGAYGISINQGFSIGNVTAMERGYIIAQAQVRGGGERGI